MVTYTDSDGISHTYHIPPRILKVWNRLKDGRLIKQDEDRVYLVDGRERSGKSLFTMQQAKYLDPTFNVDRVCFTPDEFLNSIRTAKKGQVVIFDEAFRGLSSKSSLSRVNKSLVQAMMEVGQRNLIIFIVLPTIFLLETYAILRSHCLFHIKIGKNRRRQVKVYNHRKTLMLYQYGKKRGFSYAFPKSKLKGNFFNIYPIDEVGYRKKKENSLIKIEATVAEEPKEEQMDKRTFNFLTKAQERVEKLVYIAYLKEKSIMKATKWLNDVAQVDVGKTQVAEWVRREREKRGFSTPPAQTNCIIDIN